MVSTSIYRSFRASVAVTVVMTALLAPHDTAYGIPRVVSIP